MVVFNELILLRMVIVRVRDVAVGGKRKIVAIREEQMLRIEKKKKKKSAWVVGAIWERPHSLILLASSVTKKPYKLQV